MGNRSFARSKRRQLVRRTPAGLVAALLLSGSLAAIAPTAASADTGTGAASGLPAPTADASALATAESSGTSVPVTADNTDTSTTQANPDGTFTYTETADPTQVDQNGSWVPVDPTLHQNSDGSLAPNAVASSVAFSGGGTSPLVTLTAPTGEQMSLSWPSALPTPTVSGATATYSGVYPGVNLAMTATVYGGYTEQLIVTSATAAANPALQDIHFNTSTTGLTLSTTTAGGLQATDASGNTVFTSPTATMWSTPASSSSTPAGTAAATKLLAAAPSSSASTAPVAQDDAGPVSDLGIDVTSSGLDLLPPATALTGSSVNYPVVIDPTVGPPILGNAWTWISKTDGDTSFWQGGNNTHDSDAHVGFDDWCSGTNTSGCASSAFGITRSLFSMKTSDLAGKHVTAASFDVNEQGPTSSESGTRKIDIHGAAAFDSSTTWNNQPTPWGTVAASANFASLNNTGINSANFDVTSLIQGAVASGYQTQTFVMEADDETDDTSYRYMIGNGSNDPKLSVTYYSTPDVPKNLTTTNDTSTADCNTTAPGTWIDSSDSKSIWLDATISSPDGGVNGGADISADFWYRKIKPTEDATWSSANTEATVAPSNDGPAPVQTQLTGLTDGEEYEWGVADWEDGFGSIVEPGPGVGCYFSTDFTPPTIGAVTENPPTVAGGTPGNMTISATDGGTDPSGVARILYNINGTSLTAGGTLEQSVPSNGSATTIPLTTNQWGTNTVWYAAEDAAGNISQAQSYSFSVAAGTYTTGTAGDLDGDGKPDLVAVDPNGNIDLYSNPLGDSPATPNTYTTVVKASDASGYTGATSFTGALIAHSGSVHGKNCDDLDIISNGQLLIEENNTCATDPTFTPTVTTRPSTPASGTPTTAVSAYDSTDWSQAQQLIALSSPVKGVLATTDLISLEKSGGTEYLWEFPMNGPVPGAPTLLDSGSAWSGVTLINAGVTSTGSHVLWTRNNTTGAVTQYLGIDTDTTNTLGTGEPVAGTALSATAYPLITGAGNITTAAGSGPALWTIAPSGTLQLIQTTIDSSNSATVLAPDPMTATGWGSRLTAIS